MPSRNNVADVIVTGWPVVGFGKKRKKNMKNRVISVLASLLLCAAMSAQNSIRVEVHNVVALDEQFSVTFVIEGDSPSDFDWQCPQEFQSVWGPQKSSSSSISIINGKRTSSKQVTYSYILLPTAVGKYTIPAARATVKGNQIASIPVGIEVVPSSSSSAASQQNGSSHSSGNGGQSSNPNSSAGQNSSGSGQVQNASADDIFLRFIFDRTNVVVGQPITATLKLYQRVDIAGFENASFPTFTGFWSQEVESPSNIEFARENFNGVIYSSAVLRKYILIPQQSGKLEIAPAELVCLVNVRTGRRSGSIFDSFFDDYSTVRRRVVSKACTVNVSALPSGAPDSFFGGVGKFTVSAKLTRDSLKMHEANSLIVTVSGTGNVSLLSAPSVKFPHDMEVYDTKVTDKSSKSSLSGSRQYEFPFIPRSYGDFTIEPLSYSYYDVDSGKYVTLKTAPLSFHVEKVAESSAGGVVVSSVQQSDVRNIGNDIRFIYTKNPSLSTKGHFFVGSVLFYVLVVLIMAIAVACWFVFRGVASRRADVVGSRTRKATKKALKRLRLAESYLEKNSYSEFYEELHKSMVGFISDKLNMPVTELNKENISARLSDGGVSDETIAAFVGLIDGCEFARYSPSGSSDDMKENYDKAVSLISEIDSNMKSVKKQSSSAVSAIIAVLIIAAAPYTVQAQETEHGAVQSTVQSVADDMAQEPVQSVADDMAQGGSREELDYPQQLWKDANAAYADGRWSDAAAKYEMIVSTGLESPKLYYNLGNAEYKSGNLSGAILNYERALKVDPSFADARYNLEFVESQTQDRIESVPEFILKTWTKKLCYLMDSDGWAIMFIVLLALTAGMLLLFFMAPSVAGKRTGFILAIVFFLLTSASLGFSVYQRVDYSVHDEAVVMRPVISVKSSPSSDAGTDLFILHEGTKVRVMDSVGEWVNVEISDGRQGWINSAEIEII